MMTDPIADMLARIRNAIMAKHDRVEMPTSKIKKHIAEILKLEGYIDDYSMQDNFPPTITLQLKYGRDRANAILGLKRISRPGRRESVGRLEGGQCAPGLRTDDPVNGTGIESLVRQALLNLMDAFGFALRLDPGGLANNRDAQSEN